MDFNNKKHCALDSYDIFLVIKFDLLGLFIHLVINGMVGNVDVRRPALLSNVWGAINNKRVLESVYFPPRAEARHEDNRGLDFSRAWHHRTWTSFTPPIGPVLLRR